MKQVCTCSDFPSNDINNQLPSKTSCKYYSVSEYELLDKKQNLNMFHSNINGLEHQKEKILVF